MICELRITISNGKDGGVAAVVGQASRLSSEVFRSLAPLDRRDACPTILLT
jgi:hypothetical protein